MEEQKIKNLIKVWYKNKGKGPRPDPVFKFLVLWICFNAWLDYRANKDSDGKMIEWLVTEAPEDSDLIKTYQKAKQTKPFVESLRSLALETQKKSIKSRRGSHRSIRIRDEDDFENIVWAIYKIRCHLFHGEKAADDTRDQKLITTSNRILEKWIGNLVDDWR